MTFKGTACATNIHMQGLRCFHSSSIFQEAEIWRHILLLCQHKFKNHAVIKFLNSEKVTMTEIHHHLKAVYGDNAANRSTVNMYKNK
jgi:hypothetical protein